MKIKLITALSSFEVEDAVIEVLTQREFSLERRVTAKQDLMTALISAKEEDRYLVVCDEYFAISPRERKEFQGEHIVVIEISAGAKPNPIELLEIVYERLRAPEPESKIIVGKQLENWIGFTGSCGSPGISTIALNVAAELSLTTQTLLVDADHGRGDLCARLGMKNNGRQLLLNENLKLLELAEHNAEMIDDNLAANELADVICIDIGDAPDLERTITDRRVAGKKYFENLQRCRNIVYVTHPEPYALMEMERFAHQMLVQNPKTEITYVLNKLSTSSRQSALKRRFQQSVKRLESDRTNFLIPFDHNLLDRTHARFATVLEVAPRSALRKGIRSLSVYLNNLTSVRSAHAISSLS